MHEEHSQYKWWESKWLKSTETSLELSLAGCQIRELMSRAHKDRRSGTESDERALASRKPQAKRISTKDSDTPIYSSAQVFH